MNPSSNRFPLRHAYWALGLLAATQVAFGQVAAAPSAPATSAAQEESIMLPPFEIRSEKDEGYLAQNTTSGSRLNTSLRDTAAPISVFTQEFLNDIGATDIAGLADYTVSTERVNGIVGDVANGNEFSGATASLRVRGLSADRMVNFFPRTGEVDTYNVERVELSRGPNALLFGLGGAGGVFSTTTKKADLTRTIRAATLRVGDYDATRASVDLNQQIVPKKLALRVNALDAKKNSWRPHEYNDAERLAIASRWQILPKVVMNAEYEFGRVNRATHRAWAGFDSYTTWHNAGEKLDPKVASPGLTLAQTRTALGITASAVSTATVTNYAWAWNATDGQLINYSSPLAVNAQSRSAMVTAPVSPDNPTPGSGAQENPMLLDFGVVPSNVALGGPGIGNLSDQAVFTTNITAEPVKNLFFDLAFNRATLNATGYDIGNTELRVQWDTSPTTVTGAPNPHAGQPFIEALPNRRTQQISSSDLRLTSSYETRSFGKILGRHKLSGLLERRSEETGNQNYVTKLVVNPANATTADHAANTVRYRTYVDLHGPVDAIASANLRSDPTGRTAWVSGGVTDVKRLTDTAMFATQSYFWNDRIVGTFGYRKDSLKNYDSTTVRGPAYGPFAQGDNAAVRSTTPTTASGVTRTQGIVVHALPQVSLFYNSSSSFNLAVASNRLVPNSPSPNADGESDDLGMKVSLLNGKIFATVTYYQTASVNDTGNLNQGVTSGGIQAIWDALNATTLPGHTRTILAENGLTIDAVSVSFNAYTLDTVSQGWEYDLVANPTSNWRLSLSFADRKSTQTNIAPELLAYMDKYRPLWTSPGVVDALTANNQTVGTRLGIIDGDHETRLIRPNGLSKIGDAQYSAVARTNYGFREGWLKGISVGGGARWRGETTVGYTSTLQPLKVKGYTLVDATLGYRTKARLFGKKLDVNIQLNVNNVLDEKDIIPTRVFDNGSIRTYRFQDVRDWFVTANVQF